MQSEGFHETVLTAETTLSWLLTVPLEPLTQDPLRRSQTQSHPPPVASPSLFSPFPFMHTGPHAVSFSRVRPDDVRKEATLPPALGTNSSALITARAKLVVGTLVRQRTCPIPPSIPYMHCEGWIFDSKMLVVILAESTPPIA